MPRKASAADKKELEIRVPATAGVLSRHLRTTFEKARPKKKRDESPEDFTLRLENEESCVLWTTEDLMNCVWGLPLLYNLPLQYLLGLNVLPFGRMIMLVGNEASGKTSLGLDLLVTCMRLGGLSSFIEVENKPNPFLIRDWINSDRLMEESFMYASGKSAEGVYEYMVNTIKEAAKINPLRNVPMAFLLDSINALVSDDEVDKDQAGQQVAGYQSMRTASIHSTNLKKLQLSLRHNPVVFLATNHLTTPGGQQQGAKSTVKGMGSSPGTVDAHIPGGKMWKYLSAWILHMKKIGEDTRLGVKYPIYTLTASRKTSMREKAAAKVTVHRCSALYGTDGSIISGGKTDQYANYREWLWFDWDTALVDLLQSVPKTVLAKVMDLSNSGGKFSSDRLGVQGLQANEMGRAIHMNAELTRDLQTNVLGIRTVRELVGNGDAEMLGSRDESPDGTSPLGESTEERMGEDGEDVQGDE